MGHLFSDVRISRQVVHLLSLFPSSRLLTTQFSRVNKKVKDADLGRAVELKARSPFDPAQMESDRRGHHSGFLPQCRPQRRCCERPYG